MSDYIGYALVVNVKYFEDKENNRERTLADQVKAKRAFRKLGFETKLVTEEDDVNVTKEHFREQLQQAIDHVKEKGYRHFAVFISTHGEETRVEDHYIHTLSFYDGDQSTKEVLFKPLDQQLREVDKLILIQIYYYRPTGPISAKLNEASLSEGDSVLLNYEGPCSSPREENSKTACRSKSDCESDEDLGVQLNFVKDSALEYLNLRRPTTENSIVPVHYSAPLCISNSVIMFASPSGKAAYQNIFSKLFLESVQSHKPGEELNVLDLLKQINTKFIDEEIRLANEYGLIYNVCNIGSITHCLTRHIKYTVRDPQDT